MPKKPLIDTLLAQIKDLRASLWRVERTARQLQTARALADARAAKALAWRVDAVEGLVHPEGMLLETARLGLGMQRATFRRVLEAVERRGVVRVKGDRLVRVARKESTT